MWFHVFLIVQVIITIAMVGLILLQRSDSDGLSGLSGGGGGNSFMTGRAAANFLSRATAILATLFMANSLALAIMTTSGRDAPSLADSIAAEKTVAPAATDAGVEQPAEAATEEAPATSALPAEAAPEAESTPSVPTPE